MKKNQNLILGILWTIVACIDIFNIVFDICTKSGSVLIYVGYGAGLLLSGGLSIYHFTKLAKEKKQ